MNLSHYQKIIFPWMKGLVLSLLLVLVPISIQAEEGVPDAGADPQKSWEVLKREAYYHFFLKDYLTAATRLKLIEDYGELVNDPRIANEVKVLLGSLYLAWGMDNSAVRVFKALEEAVPPGEERGSLLLKVVKVQYQRSRYKSALETYRSIPSEGRADFIASDPSSVQAHYLAGLSHYAAGSMQEGIKRLETIPPDSSYYPYAQLTLAKAYFQLNDPAKSLLFLKDLSETDTRRNRHLTRLIEKSRLTWGQVLMEEGHFGPARRILAHIPEESPFFPDSLFGMGWTHFKEDHFLEAILTFQDLIKIAPDHDYSLEALTVLGHGYKKLGAFQTALDHYTGAIEVYSQKVSELRAFQSLFADPDAFSNLLKEDAVQEGPLDGFLKDDRIHFWVGQYRDLLKLEFYLDQKLRDMDVFEVMVDHREEVFREYLPMVRRFLKETPVKGLRNKGEGLSRDVDRAVREGAIPSLASIEESETYSLLSRAVSQSLDLGERINRLEVGSDPLMEQKKEWSRLDRWLKIALGEMVWKIKTEVPGRGDDLRRGVRVAMADLTFIEKKHLGLISSVPALAKEIGGMRRRIKTARTELLELRRKTLLLREALLPPLQEILLRASETWLNRIVRLVAAAELSQIQILDGKDRAGKP